MAESPVPTDLIQSAAYPYDRSFAGQAAEVGMIFTLTFRVPDAIQSNGLLCAPRVRMYGAVLTVGLALMGLPLKAAQPQSTLVALKSTTPPPYPVEGIVTVTLASGAWIKIRAFDIDYERTAAYSNRTIIRAETASVMIDKATGRKYWNFSFGRKFVATAWVEDVDIDEMNAGFVTYQRQVPAQPSKAASGKHTPVTPSYVPAPLPTYSPSGSSEKLMVFGGEGHKTYLGCLNCPKFATDSVFNEFGTYGSKFSADSIFNQFSEFGGAFGAHSPCNRFASDPPVIVDGAGNFYGRLTINQFNAERTKNAEFQGWIAAVCAR